MALPDRQSSGALLRQLRRVNKHQLQKQLQIPNVTGQAGAEEPGPGPALTLPPPTKVNHHCRTQECRHSDTGNNSLVVFWNVCAPLTKKQVEQSQQAEGHRHGQFGVSSEAQDNGD